jgi:hypothetical protein
MTRRFPPPWTAEEIAGGYVVRDANRQALAYVYCREPEHGGIGLMKTVYISNRGDDKNDGAIDKPVYSWKRAKEIQGGNNEIPMRFLDRASAIRCKKEAERK